MDIDLDDTKTYESGIKTKKYAPTVELCKAECQRTPWCQVRGP